MLGVSEIGVLVAVVAFFVIFTVALLINFAASN